MVSKNLVPLDKWSATNLVPVHPHSLSPRQMEYSSDHFSRGTKFWGTICPWRPNCLGTVFPEGPINWGPIVGDQMSGDHMRLGPNVLVLHRPVSNKTSDIPAPMLCNENLSALANLIFCRRVIEMAVYNSVVLQKWDH